MSTDLFREPYWKFEELFPGDYPVPPEFAYWYRLPDKLMVDLRDYQPTAGQPQALGWDEFKHILTKALDEAYESVRNFNPTYHNLRHFVEIVEAVKELLGGYEELTENHIPDAVKQACLFAASLHDFGHNGYTFRSKTPVQKELFRPELGTDVSAEYVSMQEADKRAKRFGFTPGARLFISYLIAATTFGGSTPEGKRIGIDHIQPNDFFGCAMQLADVRPKSLFTSGILDDCAVVLGENLGDPKPKNVEEMRQTRDGFLEHVKSLMDKVDRLTGKSLTEYLGWRKAFDQYREGLNSIGTSTLEGATNGAILEALVKSYQ